MSDPPAPSAKSKTVWLAVAGVLGALGTAVGIYVDTGDWKRALPPIAVALFSALAATLRDTMAKGANAQVEAVKQVAREVKRLEEVSQEPAVPAGHGLMPVGADYVTMRAEPMPSQTIMGEPWQDREETAAAEEEGPL